MSFRTCSLWKLLSICALALLTGFTAVINLRLFRQVDRRASEISKVLLHVTKSNRVYVPIDVIRLRVKIREFINGVCLGLYIAILNIDLGRPLTNFEAHSLSSSARRISPVE